VTARLRPRRAAALAAFGGALAPFPTRPADAGETRSMTRMLHAPEVAVPPVPALTSGLVDRDFVHVTGQLAYDRHRAASPPGSTPPARPRWSCGGSTRCCAPRG
jgi:hypothetical protein